MWFYILDPVKEYGCAPWPKVENLIKKCLKENPQERPTSSQVLLRVLISIFVISDTVNLLCFLKRNGKIILVKGMVFFLLLYFSGAEISMEYCLDLLSRINVSIHISQPFIGNLLFFNVWWYIVMVLKQNADHFVFFTRVIQKGLFCVSVKLLYTVPCT